MGGSDMARQLKMGGPEMAPQTPQPSERPGEAVALLYNTRRSEARQSPVGAWSLSYGL